MQRHRFFAGPGQFGDSTVSLDEDEARHLTRVLRLREGARVFVFNGAGDEFECEVARIEKHEVELRLLHKLDGAVESALSLTLAQALIKGDKFDLVVQKAVELGITRIVPVIAEHSEIRRVEERTEQKLQRWRRIALEAVKQCGRRKLIEIADPVEFIDYCKLDDRSLKLICNERGGKNLKEIVAAPTSLSLAVAPEGGWSEAEIESALNNDFIPVHLGPRTLRTETAAIVAVALAQHRFGDI